MGLNVKITTMPSLLDLIAPHSCRGCGRIGSPLCNRCKKYILKNKFQNPDPKAVLPNNFPPIFFASSRTGLIDDLIHNYKYASNRSLAKPLAEILNHSLPQFKKPVIVVPLPTISRHIRERGFDHTRMIAKRLVKIHPGWQVQSLLTRVNNTVQVGSDKQTREAQAAKAYQINPKIKVKPNTTYLLIDDVWTTGASMLSAVKKLQQAGVSDIVIGILAMSQLK